MLAYTLCTLVCAWLSRLPVGTFASSHGSLLVGGFYEYGLWNDYSHLRELYGRAGENWFGLRRRKGLLLYDVLLELSFSLLGRVQ